ncbi:MAG TPA: tripartite tricarboxylate transporter substrate-binding protein, partial [Burkholderiales bacterium]|nr:tripartite tricarboxylate transporter substrate-binding protein [Burkholderiales bacterium]
GLLAPARTPRSAIARLNESVVAALKTPEVKQRLSALGVDAAWSTPAEFGQVMREEIAKWTKAARAIGYRAS